MGKLRNQIGVKLRKIRGTRTQVDFAKIIGISKSSLNRMEIGEQNISIDTIEIICYKLKISASEFFAEYKSN